LIFRLDDDLGSFCCLDGIGSLRIGRVVKPGAQDAGRIPDANLDVGPVRNPTPCPDPFLVARWNIDGTGRIYRRLLLMILNDRIRILENSTVQAFVVIGVLGYCTPGRDCGRPVLLMDLLQVPYIVGVKEIEAKAEPDHRSENCYRFVPVLSPFPSLGPPVSLLGRIFPEVDPMAKPIVPVSAEPECPSTVHDIQGNGEPSTVITDDGAVIVVETHGLGKTRVTPK